MQNPPSRQPRVGPGAPRMRRTWFTPACLAVAIVLAGAVMLPPFAAGTLFPGRTVGSSGGKSRTTGPVESAAPQSKPPVAAAAQTNEEPHRTIEAKYGELPLAAEPASERPRRSASDVTGALGTLATGIFASRITPESGTAAESSGQLTVPSIPSLAVPLQAPTEPQAGISPPPIRREPLPLQTDLLPAETPSPASSGKPGPDRHG